MVFYVIRCDNDIYPVEVQSGRSSQKKSLLVYMNKYQPRYAIRCSPVTLKYAVHILLSSHILNVSFYFLSQCINNKG